MRKLLLPTKIILLLFLFSCRSTPPGASGDVTKASPTQYSSPGTSVGGDAGLQKDSLKPSGVPKVHIPGSKNKAREDSIRKSKGTQ